MDAILALEIHPGSWPTRPDNNEKAIPSSKGMAISKGKHVDSSRTDYSDYSKNLPDFERNGREKRPSQSLDIQQSTNSPSSPSSADDLQARTEAAQRDEKAILDPAQRSGPAGQCDPVRPPNNPDDIFALLADLDMDALAGTETTAEVIAEMTAEDLDAADERARAAEEARLQRIRKAREHLEATLAKRALEWRSKNV